MSRPDRPADDAAAEGAPDASGPAADHGGGPAADDGGGPAADDAGGPAADDATRERRTEADWARRRRLAAVFGDVLPDTTRDERDAEDPDESGSDEWLRRQVPPHHG